MPSTDQWLPLTADGIDLKLTLGSGHVYEAWGLLTGLLFGALGGMWAARSLLAAPIAVGLAFACEPLIVWFLVRAGIWDGGGLLEHQWLWATEVLIGIAFVVAKALSAKLGCIGGTLSEDAVDHRANGLP